MDGAAVSKVADLAIHAIEPKTITIEGRTFSAQDLTEVAPRREDLIPTLAFASLDSLLGYINGPIDAGTRSGAMLHVTSPTTVVLHGAVDEHNRRPVLARAEYAPPRNTIGDWQQAEQFIIGLQALYADTPDRARAFGIVGNVADEQSAKAQDDGVTQTVVLKRGVTSFGEERIDNPFLLAPFGTFTEVEQVARPFILRLRGGSTVNVLLVPCDGGAWELEAMKRVRGYLEAGLLEHAAIPVYA